MGIPCSESFMHLHLGIKGDGLDLAKLGGHHVVAGPYYNTYTSPLFGYTSSFSLGPAGW